MTYGTAYSVCRFCERATPRDEMLKYGTRHYAHWPCFLKHKGPAAVLALHPWQLRRMPVLLMLEAGLTKAQYKEIGRKIEAGDV